MGDDFGSVLRSHRLLAGLTQEELALLSGVAMRTISDLERGRVRRPHRRTVDQLTRVLTAPGAAAALVSAARAAGIGTSRPAEVAQYRRAAAAQARPAVDPVPGFVGREHELGAMDARLEPEDHQLLVLSGPPGVGKTTLARQWAHRVAGQFPGGCLFLDLHGFSGDEPLSVADALGSMLRGLGVAAEEVPAGTDGAATMLRELTAGLRLLVILDNARDTAQARALIMTSPNVTTIVTSRQQLPGLVVSHAASTMQVPMMSRVDSVRLLSRLAGPAQPDAAAEMDELAAACADLPLALRIAAARLSTMVVPAPRSLAHQISVSASDALAIDDEDQAAIWASFDTSYQALSDRAQEVFLLLGIEPIADFSGEVAAALVARPRPWVQTALAELVRACLIFEAPEGRYACHDLLRSFAEMLAGKLGPAERRRVVDRLRGHLVARAAAAVRLLHPQMIRLSAVDQSADETGFADQANAITWLSGETAGVLRVIRHAASDAEAPQSSWQLADALRGWFFHQRTPDWIGVTQAALTAAQRAGATDACASMHASLGLALQCSGSYTEAAEEFRRAIGDAQRCGWARCEAAATGNLGSVHYQLGELDAALDMYTAALELNERTGNIGGQAIRIGNIGGIHRIRGEADLAESCYRRALELYERVGSASGQGMMLVNLGNLAADSADSGAAQHYASAALALAGQASSVPLSCLADTLLARAAWLAGDPAGAVALAGQALEDSQLTGDPHLTTDALIVLAEAHRSNGQPEEAARRAAEAADLAAAARYKDGLDRAQRELDRAVPSSAGTDAAAPPDTGQPTATA